MQFLTASLLGVALIGSPLLAQQAPPGTQQQPATPDQAQPSTSPPEQGMNMHHAHAAMSCHTVHHSSYHHHAMRCSCPTTHMRMHHHAATHHAMKTKTTSTKS